MPRVPTNFFSYKTTCSLLLLHLITDLLAETKTHSVTLLRNCREILALSRRESLVILSRITGTLSGSVTCHFELSCFLISCSSDCFLKTMLSRDYAFSRLLSQDDAFPSFLAKHDSTSSGMLHSLRCTLFLLFMLGKVSGVRRVWFEQLP